MHFFQFGKSTDNKDDDVVGMPETLPIKIARGVAKVATKVLPFIAKSGLVDENVAEMMTDAGEAIEKQENMDRNTSITDRVKGGGKCTYIYIYITITYLIDFMSLLNSGTCL